MLKNSHIDAYLLPIHTLKAKLSQNITQKYYLRYYPRILCQKISHKNEIDKPYICI